MQAVIKYGSSQFLVSPGQEIMVMAPRDTSGSLTFDQVLLFNDGDTTQIGTPLLAGFSVTGTVLGQKRIKIRVFKYKAKSRYRKTTGSKSILTRVKIEKIATLTPAHKSATTKKAA